MKRVLENPKRISVNNIFRGRKVFFNRKQKRVFDMELEEERAEYYFWKERYEFIIDITRNTIYGGDKNEVNRS